MIGKRVMKRLLKKDHNHSVFNYRPGSLLLKCSKIFQKLVFDAIFQFMVVLSQALNQVILVLINLFQQQTPSSCLK